MIARVALAAAAVFAVSAASAETASQQSGPLSAIGWLSDSIAVPQDAGTASGVAKSAAPDTISVTPLGVPSADAAGLLPADVTGLPRTLWAASSTEDILAVLTGIPRDLPPALRDFLKTLLLAEANPPADSDGRDRMFLARVDRLLAMGALDEAEKLLKAAGLNSPERFRRYFDIALLKGNETSACATMRARPEISPTYPARIFCLARGGDWPAAALTLETAEALGILTPAEDDLLARFLDPDIVGDARISRDGRIPTPLTFRMLEAIGEPVATSTLPVAYAWADLRPTRGRKAQIEATERLVRAGAISSDRLFDLYLRKRPSASGGVWDRASAITRLDRALEKDDDRAAGEALAATWEEMLSVGLEHAFVAHYGTRLAHLDHGSDTARIAVRIAILDRDARAVMDTDTQDSGIDPFLLALSRGLEGSVMARDPVSLAIRQGFLRKGPPSRFAPLTDAGRHGEALLTAIRLFSEGAMGDPDRVSDAIAYLRSQGHSETARRAALEILLQERIG